MKETQESLSSRRGLEVMVLKWKNYYYIMKKMELDMLMGLREDSEIL